MARKRRVRRPRTVRPVVKEEEVLEEELPRVEEEEVEEAPKPRRRKVRKVEPEFEPEPEDDEEYDDDEYEEEEPPKPAPKSKPRRRKVKVVEPEPEVAAISDLDVFYGLLEGLLDGELLTITRTGEDTWTVSSGEAKVVEPAVQKLRGRAFWSEVCIPEYLEHEEEWGDLTLAEKKANAKKLKVKWEKHEDARVDNIRMTQAVRKHLGIVKFKPQYTSRAARAAIRG